MDDQQLHIKLYIIYLAYPNDIFNRINFDKYYIKKHSRVMCSQYTYFEDRLPHIKSAIYINIRAYFDTDYYYAHSDSGQTYSLFYTYGNKTTCENSLRFWGISP